MVIGVPKQNRGKRKNSLRISSVFIVRIVVNVACVVPQLLKQSRMYSSLRMPLYGMSVKFISVLSLEFRNLV